MKVFHISDVLTVTTGRLVSASHMDGVYDILNFLTGDSLYTHALPRAMKECEPWLRAQFPTLFPDNPLMEGLISGLDSNLANIEGDRKPAIARWVESVRVATGLPEHLPVYEMGADMHTVIDPIEELEAMVGKDRVIVVEKESR
jgi:hypothetical protein